MIGRNALNDHDRFGELCALASLGTLTSDERSELDGHLRICERCRELHNQYLFLVVKGFPRLAGRYDHPLEHESWDCTATRKSLLARIRAGERRFSSQPSIGERIDQPPIAPILVQRLRMSSLVRAAIAACVIVTVGVCTYQVGRKTRAGSEQAQASAEDRLQKLAAEKRSLEKLLADQKQRYSELSVESSQKGQELAKLRSAFSSLEDRANDLVIARSASDEQLAAVSQERRVLIAKLQEAEQSYQASDEQLAAASQERRVLIAKLQEAEQSHQTLQAERDAALRLPASLESQIGELSAVNRDQERKLRDDEEYLAHDRDIRELMGARKLYIADVFDVDSVSHKRQPFGRVFYTQGKSLLFYAFDLDHETSPKSAGTFQVWGQRVTAKGEHAEPTSLGILYEDSESNRRWVLRCDDPRRMAEIEAVFVTVEPHGGSPKPTGKPFLYALLRKETNHP
jgi:hypothetical protein